MDDRPRQDAPPPGPEWFLTKDRAKRFVFRLEQVRQERATYYRSEAIGMRSFAEAVPVLLALEEDMVRTVEDVLAGRLRDRERGETEIPFVAALEGVLERTRRARLLEDARRRHRAPPTEAPARILALLADATRRLDAFAEVYDAKRFLALPKPADLARLLARVEADAALDAAAGSPLTRLGATGPAIAPPPPPLVTAADALEDLLRAARAEVPAARPPWRLHGAGPAAPLALSVGAGDPSSASDALPSILGPDPAQARTDRAAAVLKFAHPVSVARTRDADGTVVAVHVQLADTAAAAVATRVEPLVALPPEADAAVRAYVLAAGKHDDPLAPPRLVATMGVFRAVDRELSRVLGPDVASSGARVTARAVPREASRKAPVHREVLAALAAAVPGFPVHRGTEVLDAVADGKVVPTMLRPPDVAVVLAVLGRRWPGGKPFGDRALGLPTWTEDDVLTSVRDVLRLAEVRSALEKGRDPGEGWSAGFEAAAFGLLSRLARAAAS